MPQQSRLFLRPTLQTQLGICVSTPIFIVKWKSLRSYVIYHISFDSTLLNRTRKQLSFSDVIGAYYFRVARNQEDYDGKGEKETLR